MKVITTIRENYLKNRTKGLHRNTARVVWKSKRSQFNY